MRSGSESDMCYITPKIAVVSYPCDLDEFSYFLMTKHASRYRIFDFSEVRKMSDSFGETVVESYHMIEELPGSLHALESLLMAIDLFLSRHGSNLAILHCESGFQKSGFVAICLLMYLGIYKNSKDAIDFFGTRRLGNAEDIYQHLSVDYIRYIHYYECTLRSSDLTTYTYQLDAVKFITVPNFESSISQGGCSPYFHLHEVNVKDQRVQISPVFEQGKGTERFDIESSSVLLDLSQDHIKVFGDVVLSFHSENFFMFRFCFNTTFIEDNLLSFEKSSLEIPRRDHDCLTFHRDFKVELYLHRVKNKVI